MYRTNAKIKKFLIEKGFRNLYLFPHSRFQKDYVLEDLGFDAFGWKENDKRIYLFQFKSNKKPTKNLLKKYKDLEKKYYIKCLWAVNSDRKGVEIYTPSSN